MTDELKQIADEIQERICRIDDPYSRDTGLLGRWVSRLRALAEAPVVEHLEREYRVHYFSKYEGEDWCECATPNPIKTIEECETRVTSIIGRCRSDDGVEFRDFTIESRAKAGPWEPVDASVPLRESAVTEHPDTKRLDWLNSWRNGIYLTRDEDTGEKRFVVCDITGADRSPESISIRAAIDAAMAAAPSQPIEETK